jgi:hypothetical protein
MEVHTPPQQQHHRPAVRANAVTQNGSSAYAYSMQVSSPFPQAHDQKTPTCIIPNGFNHFNDIITPLPAQTGILAQAFGPSPDNKLPPPTKSKSIGFRFNHKLPSDEMKSSSSPLKRLAANRCRKDSTTSASAAAAGGAGARLGMGGRGGLSPPPSSCPPFTTATASAQANEHRQDQLGTCPAFSPAGSGPESTGEGTATATVAVPSVRSTRPGNGTIRSPSSHSSPLTGWEPTSEHDPHRGRDVVIPSLGADVSSGQGAGSSAGSNAGVCDSQYHSHLSASAEGDKASHVTPSEGYESPLTPPRYWRTAATGAAYDSEFPGSPRRSVQSVQNAHYTDQGHQGQHRQQQAQTRHRQGQRQIEHTFLPQAPSLEAIQAEQPQDDNDSNHPRFVARDYAYACPSATAPQATYRSEDQDEDRSTIAYPGNAPISMPARLPEQSHSRFASLNDSQSSQDSPGGHAQDDGWLSFLDEDMRIRLETQNQSQTQDSYACGFEEDNDTANANNTNANANAQNDRLRGLAWTATAIGVDTNGNDNNIPNHEHGTDALAHAHTRNYDYPAAHDQGLEEDQTRALPLTAAPESSYDHTNNTDSTCTFTLTVTRQDPLLVNGPDSASMFNGSESFNYGSSALASALGNDWEKVDENVSAQKYAGERKMAGPDKGKCVPPGVYQNFLTFRCSECPCEDGPFDAPRPREGSAEEFAREKEVIARSFQGPSLFDEEDAMEDSDEDASP